MIRNAGKLAVVRVTVLLDMARKWWEWEQIVEDIARNIPNLLETWYMDKNIPNDYR